MRMNDAYPAYNDPDDVCSDCPKCDSDSTHILNFFYPEPNDMDQRQGYQAECKICSCHWDQYT